MFTHLFHPMRV